MRRLAKILLWTIGGLLLLIAGFFGFFFWSLDHASIIQSDGPVTREKALRHVSISLPLSAHDVQYASYSCGLQNGEQYVRFEAPVADCHAAAQALFAARAKGDRDYVVPKLEPVSHPPRAGSQRLRTGWFDTDRIDRGVAGGSGYGWQPRVWIDEELGVFYYSASD